MTSMKPISLPVLIDSPRSAPFNMAADLFLLSRCSEDSNLFLRFYSWENPTITLGYQQKANEVLNKEMISDQSISWIRRPTGGRAVFHSNDITYSLIFSKKLSLLGSNINETYHIISQCLIRGLAHSSISCSTHDSELNSVEAKGATKLPCFLAPNRNEIMVQGKKLIGSAQKRTDSAVLQHGSIPISKEFIQLPKYENIDQKSQKRYRTLLKNKCTCIVNHLNRFDKHLFINNLIAGFCEVLGLHWYKREWSKQELKEIQALSHSRSFLQTYVEDE